MANSSLFLEHHTFQYSWLNMVVPSAFFIHLPQLPYFQSPVDILVYNTEKRVGLYSFSVLIKLTQVSVFLQIVFSLMFVFSTDRFSLQIVWYIKKDLPLCQRAKTPHETIEVIFLTISLICRV